MRNGGASSDIAVRWRRRVFGAVTWGEIRDLLFATRQPPCVERYRSRTILSRARLVAGAFALLTPLWIPIDLVVFDTPLGGELAGLRLLSTLAFVGLGLSHRGRPTRSLARWALAWLLTIPTVFYLISQPLMTTLPTAEPVRQVFAAGYSFLPFVVVAGLAVFPVTGIEGAALSAVPWSAYLLCGLLGYRSLPFASQLGALWLLLLLATVASLAGMSQLHFMRGLVDQSAHDALTGAYNRQIGDEMAEAQLSSAARTSAPLAVAFVDLDDFKSINDVHGHEAGDAALRTAAEALRNILRHGDILIRWGGEEFVLLMPNTDAGGARAACVRLLDGGMGTRPDGKPLTASIGIAAYPEDGPALWSGLTQQADRRMYAAKRSGKNRIVDHG